MTRATRPRNHGYHWVQRRGEDGWYIGYWPITGPDRDDPSCWEVCGEGFYQDDQLYIGPYIGTQPARPGRCVQRRMERWAFSQAELRWPLALNSNDPLLATGLSDVDPVTGAVITYEFGVQVYRNGAVSNLFDDGTAGVSQRVSQVAREAETLVHENGESTLSWFDVLVDRDGALVEFLANGTWDAWRILNLTQDLWWSNEDGWGDYDSATTFPAGLIAWASAPPDGMWVPGPPLL